MPAGRRRARPRRNGSVSTSRRLSASRALVDSRRGVAVVRTPSHRPGTTSLRPANDSKLSCGRRPLPAGSSVWSRLLEGGARVMLRRRPSAGAIC